MSTVLKFIIERILILQLQERAPLLGAESGKLQLQALLLAAVGWR